MSISSGNTEEMVAMVAAKNVGISRLRDRDRERINDREQQTKNKTIDRIEHKHSIRYNEQNTIFFYALNLLARHNEYTQILRTLLHTITSISS